MQSVDCRFFTRTGRGAVLALAALAVAGCADQDVTEPAPPSAPSFSVTQESATLFEAFGAPSAAWGTATIKRGPKGVQVQLRVTDQAVQAALEGAAITIWLASFHDPSECAAAPCAASDLSNPLVGAALQRAGGLVLGNGPINLAVNVREGDTKNKIGGTAAGLIDAETDEIHVVIRSHGVPIPGKVASQIHTPAGGCKTVNGKPIPEPDPEGNDCLDVAVAIFEFFE